MTWTTPLRFKTDNGLAVSAIGKGPLLVLLHGVGLRSESWRELTEVLSGNFSIQAIDLPGHGESESLGLKSPTLEDYSDTVTAYLETLDHPVFLTGHSMGAMITLDIAIRYPHRIKHIAALNAIHERSEIASDAVKKRADALKGLSQNDLNTDITLARWFGDEPTGALFEAAQSCRKWLHETSISEYQKAYKVFAHHKGLSSSDLAQLNRPALFITGADDPNSTPDMSRQMAELAPMGTSKIIAGAAHMMPMTHAADVAAALIEHSKG